MTVTRDEISDSIRVHLGKIANGVYPYSPNGLAQSADCAWPDAPDSPGADALRRVAVGIVEVVENRLPKVATTDDLLVAIEEVDSHWEHFEVADSIADYHTHTMARAFVDLCAYREDVSDYLADSEPGDLIKPMGLALLQIGQCLADALLQDLTDLAARLREDEEG